MKNLKSKLWFIYRGLKWIIHNLIDNPVINDSIPTFSIWKTVKWKDIKCYKFGVGEEKILYFWWIHWNEIWTVKLMNRWVNYLHNNVVNDCNHSLQDKTIFIIPCLNLDWYELALLNPDYFSGWTIGKPNANNVDLNRNFNSSNWQAESKIFISGKFSPVSAWTSAGSEPELKALIDFIDRESIKTIYNYHNCWSTVFTTSGARAEELWKRYSEKSGYRIFTRSERDNMPEYQKTGHIMTWWEENDVDVVEIELHSRWGSEWSDNKIALLSQ